MVRNCVIAIVAWVALIAGYFYTLRTWLQMPQRLIVALVVGSVVWAGLAIFTGARYAFRDWRARGRLLRGERPQDGDLVSAIGEIRPTFEPLHAPFSGRECVIYGYDIGPPGGSDAGARTHVGFGMTRCAVHTPHGSFLLGSFPVLEGFNRQPGDPRRAEEYVASTQFEALDGIKAIASLAMRLYTETPPLRKDWRIGDATEVTGAEVSESLVIPGQTVTASGRYVSARNELVADLRDKGYLRLNEGGSATREEALPWAAIKSLLGGAALAVGANAILWFVLQRMPR